MITSIFTLADGRVLEISDNQVISNKALIFHHGTPSDLSIWDNWGSFVGVKGVRCIAYSRAGYGRSSRKHDRVVKDINDDIMQLIEHFQIKEFVSIGWSGGGPHAIANTLLDFCKGCISIAGVAPFGEDDLDFLEGMGQDNHDEFNATLAGEEALIAWMSINGEPLKSLTAEDLQNTDGNLWSEPDKIALKNGFAEVLSKAFRNSVKNSFHGWIDDDIAFTRFWGFKVSEVNKPVIIFQGDLDFMVPHSHGKWLNKHIPHSVLEFIPQQGHVSISIDYRDKIIDSALQLMS